MKILNKILLSVLFYSIIVVATCVIPCTLLDTFAQENYINIQLWENDNSNNEKHNNSKQKNNYRPNPNDMKDDNEDGYSDNSNFGNQQIKNSKHPDGYH